MKNEEVVFFEWLADFKCCYLTPTHE